MYRHIRSLIGFHQLTAVSLILIFCCGSTMSLSAAGFSQWFGTFSGKDDTSSEEGTGQSRGQEPDSGLPVYYMPQADQTPMLQNTMQGIDAEGYYPDFDAGIGDSPNTVINDGEYSMTLKDQWGEENLFDHLLLPDGLIYPSYLAGRKEPRLQSLFNYDDSYGWIWDITLGGRVPLYRFGTDDPVHPEGFQIDMEGAALLRLDFERGRQLAATDYRAGLPLSYGTEFWQFKFAYYHVSSHLGDQYLLDGFREKVHYVRDELVFGTSWTPLDPVRIYGEVGWAFNTGKTTKPWEFQMGAEYSPRYEEATAKSGTPFAAVDGHLFEELDFGGYFNLQVGWQWRSQKNSRFRLGFEYYNGCDDEFQFHTMYQRKYGVGFWYDY